MGDIVVLLSTWASDLKTIGSALELEASRLLDEHWLAVEAVAAALLHRSTLSSEELRRIVQFAP